MSFRYYLALFILLLTFSGREWSFKQLKRIPQWSQRPLIKAYIFGDKSKLSPQTKKIHQALNLQHLMTPSGLHLASLLMLIGLLSKRRRTKFGFLIILSIIIWPFDGLDSFKRMILFGILRTNPLYRPKLIPSFLLTFLFCFIGGQYFENPLSFSLSFIFLATLLTGENNLKIFGLIFFIQALICDWFGNPFYPLGGVFGLGLSLASPFFFPFLLLESFFDWLPFSQIWLTLLKGLYHLKGPGLNFSIFYFLPLVFFAYRKGIFILASCLCILMKHSPATPLPKSTAFTSRAPKNPSQIINLKNGVRLNYTNGMRCYSRLKVDQWSTHCYK